MFEFIVRIIGAAAIAAYCTWRPSPNFDVGWKLGAGMAAFAVLLYLLERRGLRKGNLSAVVALADVTLIAYVLASSQRLDFYGYLTLVPIAFAAIRHQSNPALMAPLAPSCVACVAILAPTMPPLDHLAWLCGFLFVATLLMSPRKEIVTLREEIEVPVALDASDQPLAPSKRYLELRESYRSLRDAYQNLERRARRDRVCSLLVEAAATGGENSLQAIAHKLREMSGLTGLTLHTSAQFSNAMVVTAISGEVPELLSSRAVPIGGATSESQLRLQFDLWLKSIRATEDSPYGRSLIVKCRNKVVGVLCLSDHRADTLQAAVELFEEAAGTVGRLIYEHQQLDAVRRRLRQAELLYVVSTVTHGAESTVALASRFVREIWPTLKLDHLAIHLFDQNAAVTLASEGASALVYDKIVLGGQVGLEAWSRANHPEVVIFDTTDDDRIEKRVALQRRVGSFALIPLMFGETPFGFLTAATHRVGGIDVPEVETLRVLCAELAQAYGRLETESRASHGLVSPREMQQALAKADSGCVVYLEPIQRNDLIADFGSVAFEHAVRNFAQRLRSTLPIGGMLCRRSEGDYIALLRDTDVRFAEAWANQATAMASMVGLPTPDGHQRVPLALRAKVSNLGKQSHQIVASEPLISAKS